MTHPRLVVLLVLSLLAAAACSRSPSSEGGSDFEYAGTRGNAASVSKVLAAARAIAQPDASVDYVAAELEGAITARTKSQTLIHYDGYRATLTTPADRVTQVTFQLVEAKPTIAQLTAELGKPEAVSKGMLYTYEFEATGSRIRILAEPVSMPADDDSLVRRIVIEGARTR